MLATIDDVYRAPYVTKDEDGSETFFDLTMKEKLLSMRSVKERTGMLMGIARQMLVELACRNIHNVYASETNAEYGYLGRSVMPIYSTVELTSALFPRKVEPYVPLQCSSNVCAQGGICDDSLPF